MINQSYQKKLYFSWLADCRQVVAPVMFKSLVNNVLAEYNPDDDLSREITITAGIRL